MRAIVFDGSLKLEDRPKPKPKKNDALIRVSLAGICNTDVEIMRGYMGFRGIIGHEFVGVVEKCADARLVGRRVVGEINAGCSKCDWCAAGMQRHCPSRSVLGIAGREGAFADYVVLPAKNLFVVPDSISDYCAVFTEPIAACFEILDQVKITASSRVAVIGDGKLGALAAQVLATKTTGVTLVGKHTDKMERIHSAFGIKAVLPAKLKPGSFDIAVECSGNESGLALATSILKPRGTLVLKSTFHEKPCIDTALWVINEITVIGSRCGRFSPAIKALKNRTVNPEPLIDRVFPADFALDAFEFATKPGVFKVILNFGL